MSEIKPVARLKCGNGGYAHCQGCYEMEDDEDSNYVYFSAYEAKCNEVTQLQKENFELKAKKDCLVRDKDHLQFILDSVMLEHSSTCGTHCPDEMTEEQMENWKKHQRKVDISDGACRFNGFEFTQE